MGENYKGEALDLTEVKQADGEVSWRAEKDQRVWASGRVDLKEVAKIQWGKVMKGLKSEKDNLEVDTMSDREPVELL